MTMKMPWQRQGTDDPAPRIANASDHIDILDRMRRRKQQLLNEGKTSSRAASWYRQEIAGLVVAVQVLRYHRLAMEPATDPVAALRDLLGEIARLELIEDLEEHDRLAAAVARARRVLQEVAP